MCNKSGCGSYVCSSDTLMCDLACTSLAHAKKLATLCSVKPGRVCHVAAQQQQVYNCTWHRKPDNAAEGLLVGFQGELAHWEKQCGPADPRTQHSRTWLADILVKLGRKVRANITPGLLLDCSHPVPGPRFPPKYAAGGQQL